MKLFIRFYEKRIAGEPGRKGLEGRAWLEPETEAEKTALENHGRTTGFPTELHGTGTSSVERDRSRLEAVAKSLDPDFGPHKIDESVIRS